MINLRSKFTLPLLVALSFAGCKDDVASPQNRVPQLGMYAYSSANKTGTLRITFASADSIAGVWDVPGWKAAAAGGRWIEGTENGYGNAYSLRESTPIPR